MIQPGHTLTYVTAVPAVDVGREIRAHLHLGDDWPESQPETGSLPRHLRVQNSPAGIDLDLVLRRGFLSRLMLLTTLWAFRGQPPVRAALTLGCLTLWIGAVYARVPSGQIWVCPGQPLGRGPGHHSCQALLELSTDLSPLSPTPEVVAEMTRRRYVRLQHVLAGAARQAASATAPAAGGAQ